MSFVWILEIFSKCNSVCDIPASCLAGSNNLHDLSFSDAKVLANGVLDGDARKLRFSHSVLLEQLSLLLLSQKNVLRHEIVLSDVDNELFLVKEFHPARMQLVKITPCQCCRPFQN